MGGFPIGVLAVRDYQIEVKEADKKQTRGSYAYLEQLLLEQMLARQGGTGAPF